MLVYTAVDTLPALMNDEIYKIGKLREALQNGEFDKVDDPLLVLQRDYDLDDDKTLQQYSQQEETDPRHSANLENLYALVQIIQDEMRFVLQPNFIGKMRHDNMINDRINKYYDTGIKKYARQIRIYCDALIQFDHLPAKMFGDYRRLESLIMKTDGVQSEEYLLKLLSIARQNIPPNLITENSYVIDSNAVDPNRVSEG